ncbi:zinc finger protein 39-like [Eupeodes corollae]|uniref:zinc finger protein 39-like n=1 Tax=Eupeodes corollae TaxID=290404 RepID=UPI00248F4D3F|nr:zinc finger protein 39-like [Eupeodes corollae]
MSSTSSLCLTCLSSLEEGAKLTQTLRSFLCDILHFKAKLLKDSQKIICRKCYKTLIELKCFYTQLRDVEVYFESKTKVNNHSNDSMEADDGGVDDDDDDGPYISELECTVSMADESTLDPIVIDEDEECCVVDDDTIKQLKRKSEVTPAGRRFVCLTCSKLFSSFEELRSHEQTHLGKSPIQKASPVFVPANSPQKITCLDCGLEFWNNLNLEAHMKTHKQIRPFYCKNCKHRFENREQLIVHESKYKCVICQSKCCSRKILDSHMKEKHNGDIDGPDGKVDSEEPKKEKIDIRNKDTHTKDPLNNK